MKMRPVDLLAYGQTTNMQTIRTVYGRCAYEIGSRVKVQVRNRRGVGLERLDSLARHVEYVHNSTMRAESLTNSLIR